MTFEDKFLELLLDSYHILLFGAILSIIYMLKAIKPIRNFLFSEKWKWLIIPIIVILSSVGTILLGVTPFESFGARLCIAIVISAALVISYEALLKRFERAIIRWRSAKKEQKTA